MTSRRDREQIKGRWTARLAPLVRYLGAVAIVGATTGVAQILFHYTGDTRLSLVFLAGILVTASLLGTGPAYFAAGASFLIYNFYLASPRFAIAIQSPEDMLTLLMFTVSAALTSNLAGRVRDLVSHERARADTTSALYAATREFSASSDEQFIRTSLVRHVAHLAGGMALVREGLRTDSAPSDLAIGRDLALELNACQRASRSMVATCIEGPDNWVLRPLRVGASQFGVAAWRPVGGPLKAEEVKLLEILVDAGATAIARARLAAAKVEAETRARTEDLRNALLSSISHDLRTPLAAIMVSAGSLRRYGRSLDEATRDDLAVNIEEEATRLDDFVANLLSMARLESGELSVRKAPFDVWEVIDRTVARRNTGDRRVAVDVPDAFGRGVGDPQLFEQALGNVVENALRYTSQADAVTVSARRQDDLILVEVLDEGQGVAAGDLPRIFEKFYRAEATHKLPGTGLGLAIARGLLEGMGGTIAAANRDDGRSGLRVTLQVPIAA